MEQQIGQEIDILPADGQGEGEMAVVVNCAVCEKGAGTDHLGRPHYSNKAILSLRPRDDLSRGMRLKGVLTCLKDDHRWPISMHNDEVRDVQEAMPVTESRKLISQLCESRPDIPQDIEEAEECYFQGAYKAGVVMCRRAIQLALEFRTGETHKTLGPLLGHGRAMTPPALTLQTDQFAERVHRLGDEAAHRVVTYDAEDVKVAIHDTVVVVNELLEKPPASQSETSSNGP
jgi:hypothetical protein